LRRINQLEAFVKQIVAPNPSAQIQR
jgi:hypothetical protein